MRALAVFVAVLTCGKLVSASERGELGSHVYVCLVLIVSRAYETMFGWCNLLMGVRRFLKLPS